MYRVNSIKKKKFLIFFAQIASFTSCGWNKIESETFQQLLKSIISKNLKTEIFKLIKKECYSLKNLTKPPHCSHTKIQKFPLNNDEKSTASNIEHTSSVYIHRMKK